MYFEIEHYFSSTIDLNRDQKEFTASDREDSDIQLTRILKVRSRVDEIKIQRVVFCYHN